MLIFLPDMSSLSHDSSIGLLEFLGFPLGSLWEPGLMFSHVFIAILLHDMRSPHGFINI